ncbi:FAD-binding protein [Galbitalea soli]|uniref:FAD-binding protein n=1 Tax=Galbitalea soli TaxID=1268042 RepID=A0A7C9PPK5_9MICO|nr:FAD-binding protein [Galbitalea soli]
MTALSFTILNAVLLLAFRIPTEERALAALTLPPAGSAGPTRLVVIGAGPVGLAAAIEARLAGLDVVVVDPRRDAIDKACGEGLMPGALPLLERLGVRVGGHPLAGITYRQGARSVVHRFAGAGGRGVRRTELQSALAARADALGAERVTATVTTVEQTVNGVELGLRVGATVLSHLADGTAVRTDPPAVLHADYVLACDGLHSPTARILGLTLPNERGGGAFGRYGIREHYAMPPWGDTVEVYWGADAEFYVTPVDDSTVGVAMLGARGIEFEEALAGIPELADRLRGALVASTRRGAGPFRQRTRARTAGRVLLVGDAAGYVDAITGEGLRLGFAQAGAAVRCVAAGRPRDYEREWRAATRDFRVLTSALVALASGPLRGMIVPLAERLPRVFGAVVERLAR